MLPLSLDTPKPLMPLWGRPVIEHIISMLRGWGVKDILINLHHQAPMLLDWARARPPACPRLALSFEPAILGTGGALQRASWFLDSDPCWLINADIAAALNPQPLLEIFHERRALAALWLHTERGPRTVAMRNGLIAGFHTKPGSGFTFCGLHLIDKRILAYLPPNGFATIIAGYEKALQSGKRIAGVVVPKAYWSDIGTPATYLQAQREIEACRRAGRPGAALYEPHAPQSRRLKNVALSENVSIHKSATLQNAVIWQNSAIQSDAIINNNVIGRNCIVRGKVESHAICAEFIAGNSPHPQFAKLSLALKLIRWPPEETTVIAFAPRGSARTFMRLVRKQQSLIFVQYSRDRAENTFYAGHARLLRKLTLPVPQILLDMPKQYFFIMQDIGDQSLLEYQNKLTPARKEKIYQETVELTAKWHILATAAARRARLRLAAAFSPKLYRWERCLFARHFLQLHPQIAPKTVRAIMRELARAAQSLLQTPPTLIHRDLQSSNIMIKNGQSFFIDFQGMRYGAAAYDVASLLCDPYVELNQDLQMALLASYNRNMPKSRRIPKALFWTAAVERLSQALGAYGRLSANPGTERFRAYFAPGLRMLQRATEQTHTCPHLHELTLALNPR